MKLFYAFSADMADIKITYSDVGDDYDTKDPIKKLALQSARETGINLTKHRFKELPQSRGESAYIFKQKGLTLATVIEGLGTKNLVADAMRKGDTTYYDVIGHDTVATIINDLTTVGATPLTIHAYWAVQDNTWLADEKRMSDLISGWKSACDIAGASWGGGETPTLKGIIEKNTVQLGGSAVGIIQKKPLVDTNLTSGDRIILIKSNGINANGLSLARAVADKLPNGYKTKLPDKSIYGQALLTKTNIYANVIHELLEKNIPIHYITNITGHGLRKIMRARQDFTYVIDTIFEPQPLFSFMQQQAGLSEYEMYDEFNMGQDYALFLPEKSVKKTLAIIKKHGFDAINGGYIEQGKKQVVLKPKNITFSSDRLNLR